MKININLLQFFCRYFFFCDLSLFFLIFQRQQQRQIKFSTTKLQKTKKFPREKLAENFSLRFLKIYKRLNLKNFSFFI